METETYLRVLLPKCFDITEAQLPPLEPELLLKLLPSFATFAGPLPCAGSFWFACGAKDELVEAIFFRSGPPEFSVAVTRRLSRGNQYSWYELCEKVSPGEGHRHGPPPATPRWAAACFAADSFTRCAYEAPEVLYFLPQFVRLLIHWADSKN